MTGVFLWILGLASTGLVYPTYDGLNPIINIIEENRLIEEQKQKELNDELYRNYLAEQEQIIIEDYFLFLEQIGKIKYARGCMGEYTPPVWNGTKRVRCSDNAYDCAGLIKAYGIAKGIITDTQAKYYNSQSLMQLADKKDPIIAKRGDWTSWIGYGDREGSTHFAIISRDYEGGNTLWVYDNANGPNLNELAERPLKVVRVGKEFRYLGMYRIAVYSNGYVDKALSEGIRVDSRVKVAEPKPIPQNEIDNPLGFHIIISGFAYDSLVNRTVNRRYVRNKSEDMVGTYLCENGLFDPNSKSDTSDSGICQLNNHRGNYKRLHNPLRTSKNFEEQFAFQRQACLDKWNLVEDHNKIWACYKKRQPFMDKIIYLSGGFWDLDSI